MWSYILLATVAAFTFYIYSRVTYRSKEKRASSDYNGKLYAKLIDPLLAGMHSYAAKKIPPDSFVVDACCGTGQLTVKLAQHCSHVVGIDSSPKMIEVAEKRRKSMGVDNVAFYVADCAQKLAHKDFSEDQFHYGTVTMSLHEMHPDLRQQVLKNLSRVCGRVLVVDYAASMPWNLSGIRNRVLEFLAGKDHFANFLHFLSHGGVPALAEICGLEIEEEKLIDRRSIVVITLRKKKTV